MCWKCSAALQEVAWRSVTPQEFAPCLVLFIVESMPGEVSVVDAPYGYLSTVNCLIKGIPH